MSYTPSRSSSNSTPTRGSRRTTPNTVDLNPRAIIPKATTVKCEDSSLNMSEIAKKRPRPSPVDNRSQPAQRKSVTVLVKTQPTEEFRSQKAELAPSSSGRLSGSSPGFVPPDLPPGATPMDKVIAVIDYLRIRRRRPDKVIVLHYTEKMFGYNHKETSSFLDTMVNQGRLVCIKHDRGVSYRYHNTVVARGDNATKHSNKIKAKYAATTGHAAVTLPKVSATSTTAKQSVRVQATKKVPTKLAPPATVSAKLTQTEVNALKTFLRLISPDNAVVRPSNGGEKNGIIERVRSLLPSDSLGGKSKQVLITSMLDSSTAKPGFSIYVLPPPTPINFDTVEKTLKTLPHQLMVGESLGPGIDFLSCNNGIIGLRFNGLPPHVIFPIKKTNKRIKFQ